MEEKEKIKAQQSLFIQEVLLATLTDDKLSLKHSSEISSVSSSDDLQASNLVPSSDSSRNSPTQPKTDDKGHDK